jgi:hypothetical protein
MNIKNIEVNLDPIHWWKDNENRFPKLSKMAKDILSIPMTSIKSEQLFS